MYHFRFLVRTKSTKENRSVNTPWNLFMCCVLSANTDMSYELVISIYHNRPKCLISQLLRICSLWLWIRFWPTCQFLSLKTNSLVTSVATRVRLSASDHLITLDVIGRSVGSLSQRGVDSDFIHSPSHLSCFFYLTLSNQNNIKRSILSTFQQNHQLPWKIILLF